MLLDINLDSLLYTVSLSTALIIGTDYRTDFSSLDES